MQVSILVIVTLKSYSVKVGVKSHYYYLQVKQVIVVLLVHSWNTGGKPELIIVTIAT